MYTGKGSMQAWGGPPDPNTSTGIRPMQRGSE